MNGYQMLEVFQTLLDINEKCQEKRLPSQAGALVNFHEKVL
jgi:hypothetical protein